MPLLRLVTIEMSRPSTAREKRLYRNCEVYDMHVLKALWADEEGVVMAEYALLMALVAVAAVGAITVLRDQIIRIFNDTTTTLSTVYS